MTKPPNPRSRSIVMAALVALGLTIWWIATLPGSPTYGWDESMHVALPAARMRTALFEGHPGQAFDALLGCAQYPFVQPVALAFVQSIFGGSEHVARAFGLFEWGATLVGMFVLVRTALSSSPAWAPVFMSQFAAWMAFAFAVLSSLSLIFAGTLFLEVPSACVTVWTLVAWFAFWREPTRARAWLAGALITACIFTKWNYGLLVATALTLDCVVRLIPSEDRARRGRLVALMAVIPAIVLAWWFLFPLPGGTGVATQHRDALAGFLAGNRNFSPVPWQKRVLYLVATLAPSPRLFLLELVGLGAVFHFVREASVRTLLFVLAASWIPVFLHPFFENRFLVPGGPVFFVAAAAGLSVMVAVIKQRSPWLSRIPGGSWTVAFVLFALALVPIGRNGSPIDFDTAFVARALGFVDPAPTGASVIVNDYKLSVIAQQQTLGAQRVLPSSGLERDEVSRILDLVTLEAKPDERVGWLGMSSELSPALILFGRLERGGTRATFLRDSSAKMGDFEDPHVDADQVRAFANQFDVVFLTDPPDVRGRPSGLWAATARTMLESGGGWVERELGTVETARPMSPPLAVRLIACRRTK